MGHERRHAQDRVVAPVVRFAELPEAHAGREQRPVGARRELLDAAVQRLVADRARRGLDDAGVGVRFHQPHQRRQAFAGHDAVGVEDDEVAVGGAPAAAEVGDVAGLALDAALAPAVVDLQRRALAVAVGRDAAGELAPRRVLGGADVGIGGVAQDVDVEVLRLAGRDERIDRRREAAEDGRHVLVADRHDDRRARVGVERTQRRAREAAHERALAAAEEEHAGAHHAGPEAGRDPREEDAEEDEQAALGERRAALGQDLGHRLRADVRAEQDQDEQDEPARHERTGIAGAALGQPRQAAEQAAQRPAPGRAGPGHGRHRAARERRVRQRRRHGLSASAGRM